MPSTDSTPKKLGVDVNSLYISQPDNGEQALEIAEQLIRSSAIDVLVVDSVAALTPKSEIDGDMGDRNVGLQARLMSQAMRKLTSAIARTKTTCIFINQLRSKIGQMFGPAETTTGGSALKFYASVRLDIRPSSAIKNGDETIGRLTTVKVVKNKVAPHSRKPNSTSCSAKAYPFKRDPRHGLRLRHNPEIRIMVQLRRFQTRPGTRSRTQRHLRQSRTGRRTRSQDHGSHQGQPLTKKRSSRTPKFKRADSSAAKDNDAPADEPTDADSMPDTELPDEFSIEEDA